jgi:hypothetical protein
MMSESTDDDRDAEGRSQIAFKLFCKWYVSILYRHVGFVGEAPANPMWHIASAFVLLVAGRWLLFTAGHVVEKWQRDQSQGAIVDQWRISDAHAGAGFQEIPIEPDIEKWIAIHDDARGIDLGFIELHPLYAQQLAAGGIRPPGDAWWLSPADSPHDCSPWLIFGTPEERVKREPSGLVSFWPTMLPVRPLTELPPEVRLSEPLGEKLIFAKVVDDLPMKPGEKPIRNMEGMSGGPVVGVREPTDPAVAHSTLHIVGIQSGWLPNSRIATIYPLRGVLEVIEAALSRIA